MLVAWLDDDSNFHASIKVLVSGSASTSASRVDMAGGSLRHDTRTRKETGFRYSRDGRFGHSN